MKLYLAIMALIFTSLAVADETDSYCDYTIEKAKAEQILYQSPKLTLGGGRDSVGYASVIGLGLTESLSGYLKGTLSHQIGERDCQIYRHVSELQKHVSYDVTRLKMDYDSHRINFLNAGIEHLHQLAVDEQARVSAGTSTMVVVDTILANQQRMRFERHQLEQEITSTILPDYNEIPLRKLIAETKDLQAEQQQDVNKQAKLDNWDVSITTGGGSPMKDVRLVGPYQPFISLNAQISFGAPWRNKAINKSSEAYLRFSNETINGPIYLADELYKVVDQARESNLQSLQSDYDYLNLVNKNKSDMAKIDTIEAHRFLIQLEIEYVQNEIEYQSVKYSVDQMSKYLTINFENR